MQTKPKLEYREEQPYMAISSKVKMEDIPAQLQPLIQETLDWLKTHNDVPAGAPFFHYTDIKNGVLDVEVGFPVTKPLAGDDRVQAGTFPAGQYAAITHMGHYMNLPQVHSSLDAWTKENGLKMQGSRTEFYPTDPVTEPNPDNWQTDILMLVAEDKK